MYVHYDVSDVQQAFAVVDRQGEGFINQRKLFQTMVTLGTNPTEAEVQDLITAMDGEGKQPILQTDRQINMQNRDGCTEPNNGQMINYGCTQMYTQVVKETDGYRNTDRLT